MGLGTLTLVSALMVPGQVEPDLSPINQRSIQIPIRFDPNRRSEIKELILFVSKNQGGTWEQSAVATPDRESFGFVAPADGIYWFNMTVIDKDGRRDPADLRSVPSGLKVLIDTQAPVVNIKAADRVGDEVSLSWEIQEPYPDLAKFRVDYRGADGNWIPVDNRQTGLVGSARFRPGQSGPLTVRVQLSDLAGNRGEQSRGVAAAVAAAQAPTVSPVANRVSMSEGPAPTGMDPTPSGVQHAAAEPAPRTDGVYAPIMPANLQDGRGQAVRPEPTGAPLAVSNSASVPPANGPLPPAQVINVAKFDVAYDVESKGPSGVGKAEVWVTRDDGKSWIRWYVSEKGEAPLTVDLDTRNNSQLEGMYGLKIVLQSGAGLSRGGPQPGDLPDMRVDVDLSPPVVKIFEPIADPAQKDVMILRWQAVDRNIAAEPITLEWAESPDGPWHPIVGTNDMVGNPTLSGSGPAKRLVNSGNYPWRLPPNFPTPKVYLKVTARDTAGNLAEARTPNPIVVDLNRPIAKIQGIVGTSSQKR